MRQVERSEAVQLIPDVHRAGLDVLYTRLAFYDSHAAVSYWFCFWDDFYDLNADLKIVVANEQMFNPKYGEAIIYHPMARDELEAVLSPVGAHKAKGKCLFPPLLLDDLYQNMDLVTKLQASGNLP